ncbi:MAG: DUF998 domain-containing protein [Parvularculaceae bacterium]|nr:DUF998 domain-containing protein [Parvularculaceae bacterium]
MLSWQKILVASGITAFMLAAFIGPFMSHPAYSSVSHSVSELAGQNMPNAWIMRTGFVAFGGATMIAALSRLRADPAVSSTLCVFGAAMIAAAVWSHLPIAAAGGGERMENDLHSVAASVMGVAFASACAARLWTQRTHHRAQAQIDWLSAAGLVIAIGVPLLMLQFPAVAGVLQRGMFLFSFVWVFRAFGRGAAGGMAA